MNTAFVKIWGELVGAVAWDESTGYGRGLWHPDDAFTVTGRERSGSFYDQTF